MNVFDLTEKTKVKLLSKNEAKTELSKKDLFLNSLSPFDLQVRLGEKDGEKATFERYHSFVLDQVEDFDEYQKSAIEKIVASINRKLKVGKLDHLEFPDTVKFVRTSGREESNAAYCRNLDVICLPSRMIQEKTIIHELFHILTRNNIPLRHKLYLQVLKFLSASETSKLNFPFKNLKITNPDAAITKHYFIEKSLQNYPGEMHYLFPILFSSRNYTSGGLFGYVNFQKFLISMKFDEENDEWHPVRNKEDSDFVVVTPQEATSFFKNVGHNTNYIIHPEEILADNFVMVVNCDDLKPAGGWSVVKSPEILKKIREILSE